MQFDEYEVDLTAKCVCGCMDGLKFHKVYRFPNGYGASVTSSPKSSSTKGQSFEILLLRFVTDPPENEYVVERSTEFGSGTVKCQDWQSVEEVLKRIYSYGGSVLDQTADR